MTEFIIGQLYWHKFPFDEWENEPYYDYTIKDFAIFPTDKHGRQCHMLLFLGQTPEFIYGGTKFLEFRDYKEYGDFIFNDRKIAVKMDDLCMVDLSDKYHRYHIIKYGDK